MPVFVVARTMQMPQSTLKALNLALVVDLLSLRQFQGFEHFFHFVQRVLQFLDDPVYLLNGIGDRRWTM